MCRQPLATSTSASSAASHTEGRTSAGKRTTGVGFGVRLGLGVGVGFGVGVGLAAAGRPGVGLGARRGLDVGVGSAATPGLAVALALGPGDGVASAARPGRRPWAVSPPEAVSPRRDSAMALSVTQPVAKTPTMMARPRPNTGPVASARFLPALPGLEPRRIGSSIRIVLSVAARTASVTRPTRAPTLRASP